MSKGRQNDLDSTFKKFKENFGKAKNKLVCPGKLAYEEVKDQTIESWKKGPVYMAKDYFAATAGSMIFSFPIVAIVGIYLPKLVPFLSELDVDSSEKALMKLGGWTSLGAGYVVSKIRNGSRWAFRVDEEHNPEFKKGLKKHDGALQSILSIIPNTVLYLSDFALTARQAFSYAAVHTGANFPTGITDGVGVDLMNDLMGIRPSKRMPKFIQNMNQKVKYGLVGALVLGSYGVIQGVYKSHDYFFPKEVKVSELEQKTLEEFREFSSSEAQIFFQGPKAEAILEKRKYLKKNLPMGKEYMGRNKRG